MTGKKVLLIADDEEMNRKIISKFLKNSFDIIETENGRETMEVLTSKHVDAILLDIIMPEMDGLEVLEQIKKNHDYDNIAILVATSTKEKTERMALSLGADDIVAKPYDPLVIRKRMDNILAAKEMNIKNQIIENEDIDSFVVQYNNDKGKKAEHLIDRIKKCSDIIDANKDNFKLVTEMLDEIRRDSEQLRKLFE